MAYVSKISFFIAVIPPAIFSKYMHTQNLTTIHTYYIYWIYTKRVYMTYSQLYEISCIRNQATIKQLRNKLIL